MRQREPDANTGVDYGYDNAGQLKYASGFDNYWYIPRRNEQFNYNYDAAGNLSSRTANDLVQTFAVNNVNELTTVTRTTNMTVAGTTTSEASSVTVNGLSAELYSDATFARTNVALVNGNNTFTAIAQDAYGRKDTNVVVAYMPTNTVFVYDENGNLRTNGQEILIYDDENRLVTNYVAGSWQSEFVYDGLNRRRIQRDYTWNGSTWLKTNETRFIYDGNVIVQHRDANNLPTLALTRGLDLSGSLQRAGGIGGLLAMTENPGARPEHSYYHSDAGGNVTCLINTNQQIVAKAEYDPYGNFVSLSGPKASVNPYWFSSKPMHQPSGKYDFLYRWYAPELQRWLNRDPIGERGGINLYRFVGNAPLDRIDQFGLAPGYGNPVSGASGPVGPASSYAPGLPYYPDGFNYDPLPKPLFSIPFSAGLLASGNAEGGVGPGAGGNFSTGVGLFYKPHEGFSVGDFGGGGVFAGGLGPKLTWTFPCSPTDRGSGVFGRSIGVGSGFWLSELVPIFKPLTAENKR